MTPLLVLRESMTPARITGLLLLGCLFQNAMEYLRVFQDTPLLFRVWGFSLLPSLLVPLLVLPAVFRLQWKGGTLSWPGFAACLPAVLVPMVIFGGAVLVQMGIKPIEPGWTWTTYALSAAADLPLVLLWTFPMLFVQIAVWILPWNRMVASRASMYLSGVFFLLANATGLVYLALGPELLMSAGMGALMFGGGVCAARLFRAGGFLSAAFFMVLTGSATVLVFGSESEPLLHVLLGYDVSTVKGLLGTANTLEFSCGAGAALFVAAHLLPLRRG